MNVSDFNISNIPDTPGIYTFLGEKKEILYIGRATSLKDRIRSYFNADVINSRGPFIVDMVFKASDINWMQTDSVLEAVILEAKLIKEHTPHYNSKEKDDKSFNYIVITEEEFPRILIERGRNIEKNSFKIPIKHTFGPFTHGLLLRDALKIIRRIFPFRDAKCEVNKGKPCFNRQIGLCPGVCTGEISKRQYNNTINHLKLFFEGKKKLLLRTLENEMNTYARAQMFEDAQRVKKTLSSLTHIQDVSLIKRENVEQHLHLSKKTSAKFRIEAYDVAHLSGHNTVGVMVVVENGELTKSEYRKFKIKVNKGIDDVGALQEIMRRRLKHNEWRLPDVIVVDGGSAQRNAAQCVLHESDLSIPIISVVKNKAHKPERLEGDINLIQKYEQSILISNNEAHRFGIMYHRHLRNKQLLSN